MQWLDSRGHELLGLLQQAAMIYQRSRTRTNELALKRAEDRFSDINEDCKRRWLAKINREIDSVIECRLPGDRDIRRRR
ncbi:unnamed protein product [Protopolystoma xenopodis]|uniref:Uncharacterized protein n=1 Tax=Protopolystoma xenopodis TaxID=117903 RepID=A0A3S5AM48_9PLAT|nr:unnamed protein product [Protopolystoma xenopodis]